MANKGHLTGKVALVTGSTSGIGLAMARAMAGAGAHVVLNGFGDPVATEKLRADLAAEFGVAVRYSAADMTREDEIATMIGDVEKEFGAVDVLVNNAGMQHVAPIDEFPVDKWNQIIALNLSAAFHAIRLALPAMREKGWGRIISTASAHALVASPYKVAYVAAKHGVVGMTKVTAIELAQTGVTCNAICPGFVRTPLAEVQVGAIAKAKGISEESALKDHLLAKQPSKRWVEVEEVAGMAVYLCGPNSGAVNGSALSIDGGWTAS